MATPTGIEPVTVRLEGGCSIQLSYGVRLEAKVWRLVSPRLFAAIGEIVGIGL